MNCNPGPRRAPPSSAPEIERDDLAREDRAVDRLTARVFQLGFECQRRYSVYFSHREKRTENKKDQKNKRKDDDL
jgi:hypothetical protein